MPRTATAQRRWLAAGNDTRLQPGQEKPDDLIFWDSYLGPNQIGHIMIVWSSAKKTTIAAHKTVAASDTSDTPAAQATASSNLAGQEVADHP